MEIIVKPGIPITIGSETDEIRKENNELRARLEDLEMATLALMDITMNQ